MQKIAIIPARGGSKRIPLKNIREFYGRPIITRTVETLIESNIFDRIIVSTDSSLIAEAVQNFVDVEISMREANLSNDSANTVDVIAAEIEKFNITPTTQVCCVYAPNPFLHTAALKLGLEALSIEPSPNYVSAVTTYPFPIQRSLKKIPNSGLLTISNPEYMMTHSQDLEERYHETAQFWWALASTWKEKIGMQTNVRGILIPRWMSQDIDTLEDWRQAEIRWQILEISNELNSYVFTSKNIINEWNSSE